MAWSDALSVVEKLAPMLATGLGGPLAGGAVSMLESVFGITPSPATTIADRQSALATSISGATPDQLMAMKKADQDYTVQMASLGFKDTETLASLSVQDRVSARNMQISTKSIMAPFLAILIVLGSFIFMGAVVFHAVVLSDPVMAQMVGNIQGYLFSECKSVLSFYFGSSVSSDRKTELISQAPAIEK